MRPHKPWPGDFGSVPAHSHENLTGEWELCTENDCEVYEAEAAQWQDSPAPIPPPETDRFVWQEGDLEVKDDEA